MADLKIENLTYYYPEAEKPALDKINLQIPEGQFVLVVGGSGREIFLNSCHSRFNT